MTASEILAALNGHMKVLAGTSAGDILADLVALALPDEVWPAALGYGWGDPWTFVAPAVTEQLKAWDRVARQNTPPAEAYREAARAVRACVALIEARS